MEKKKKIVLCPRCHNKESWLMWVKKDSEVRSCKKCGKEFEIEKNQ